MTFTPNNKLENEKAGLVMMGFSYANLALTYTVCKEAVNGKPENEQVLANAVDATVYLRVTVTAGAMSRFSYSFDGLHFTDAGEAFKAETGRWIGAKVGLFCTRASQTNDSGYADFNWFRVE